MKHKCYIVDITNLKDVDSLTDFMYILYNEYVLNSEYTFDEKLRVYTYNDSDESKLKRALKKYKADKSYIDSIFKKDVKESSNIKLNNKPMKFSEYVKVSEGIDNRYEKNDVEYVEDYDEDYDEDYNEKDEKNFDDNILQNIADAINDLFIDGYVIDDTSDINDVINKVDTKLYFLYNTSLINYGIETVSDFCGVMNKINEKGLLNGNVDESVKENTKNKKINEMSDSKVRQSVMRESASDRYKSIIKKRHINESGFGDDVDNIKSPVGTYIHKTDRRFQPKTKNELQILIEKTIKEEGAECDLNFIDTSLIKDMSYLFYGSDFNGDISQWDVSDVINMRYMFANSEFDGDISKWDIFNVEDMTGIFDSCEIRIKPDWFIEYESDYEDEEYFYNNKYNKRNYEVKKMRKNDFMDEGFVYVKTDDLINEMKQEGVREYKETNKIPSFKEGNIRYDGKTINTLNDSTIKETLSVVKNDIKTLSSELSGKLSGISKYIKPEVIEEKVTKDYIKNKCDKAQCAECLDTLAELIKLKKVLYAIKRVILLRKEKANESVTSRFSVYGRVFESDDEDDKDTEDDDKDSKKDKDTEDDDKDSKKDKDTEDDDKDSKKDKDTEDDDKDSKKDKDTEDDEEETVNVTALKIVVDKDAVDKCKEDMIDYGVEEDDIEILDSEDTDENVTIKVDANSIDALRKFLDNKGIDLEEELGGSIEDEEDDKDGNEETDDEDKEDEEDEFDMSEFDNIFGDEEDEEEKGEDK